MDNDAVLAAFDRQMRRDAPSFGAAGQVERGADVVRQIGGGSGGACGGGWCGVIWSDLREETADAAIAAQITHFKALDREFEWKLYAHDRPGDLADRLRAAGFTPEPDETLMVARVEDLPTAVELPEGIRLHHVTDPADIDLLVTVHDQAFDENRTPLKEQLLTQLTEAPDTLTAVVALAGEVPVCAARMEMFPGTDFAGLWGGGTVAEWRGLGIYRALVAVRARVAAGRGFRYLQVDASDQSRPILQRLGFTPLTTTTPWVYAL
ncbi:GNAT family N-acetyltransferase [Streptomyces sp. N2-109]|uniref:GNAT family N-acetyltransferase n=1 Tax=Streptomyces gossypii TaxID=2883101 RepID=A0ABT2JYV2_9ACTN|nr:GNAT family N-acetyltransferase [Streptomyces gossypii]MCT2593077.1 GNAT family N-acetyltransferase [Streptomyces gossypii]